MYKDVHFIGIGGIGMSGIAQLYLKAGIKVSGSDIRNSERLELLRLKGAKIYLGHNPSYIQNQDLVVYSSAIKENNPELVEARRRNIKILKRAEALVEIIRNVKLITITGSHGKTTTSSLIAHILKEARLLSVAVLGGVWLNLNNSICLDRGNFFVVEADESDGSFLYFKPNYSIVTNIDFEHMDYYKNIENLLSTFVNFINNISQDGCLIACAEDKNIISILKRINKKTILYGLSPQLDVYAEDIKFNGLSSCYNCIYKDNFLGRFSLNLGGLHNVLNSLAAIAIAKELGIDTSIIKNALSTFKGTKRRIEIKSCINGIMFLDDYAHHPSEIIATLKTVTNLGYKRVIVIFQPHRYTRTKLLLDEFAKSFDLADEIIVTNIYPADEEPIEGVDAREICNKINFYKRNNCAKYFSQEDILPYVLSILRKNDLVITLGAGDIYKICDELVKYFKK
ncbi:MAG: UDP-N-acetylmuramate--L-alanine ligase [Candidatus Omnitrophica bacterium]|nr:UDP-N-acetylmuramate--L-alanine ligase [Candidatus Omnitrophota bacterium]